MYYEVVHKNGQCFYSRDIPTGARDGNFIWESILTEDKLAVTFTNSSNNVMIIPIEKIEYIGVIK